MSVNNFGKLSDIPSNISSTPLFNFISDIPIMHVIYTFYNFPMVLGCSARFFHSFFFFLFEFQLKNYSLTYLQCHWFFPQLYLVHLWAHQRPSLFMFLWFWLLAPPFDFSLEFPSLCLHYPSIHTCYLLFLLSISHIHHNYFYLPLWKLVLYESASDTCFVSIPVFLVFWHTLKIFFWNLFYLG